MNKEIKEISIRSKEQQAIDVFKEFIETKGNLEIDYSIETYMQIILDYITNLQKDIDDLDYYNKHLHTELTNLQEENESLKQQNEYLRNDEYLKQVKWERDFNENLVKDLKDEIRGLKSVIDVYTTRHDKACELIESLLDRVDYPANRIVLSKLYDILKSDTQSDNQIINSSKVIDEYIKRNEKLQEELDFIKEDANDILYKLTINEERIDRLNNIINELENYLENEYLEWKDSDVVRNKIEALEDKTILDKLRELKGKYNDN